MQSTSTSLNQIPSPHLCKQPHRTSFLRFTDGFWFGTMRQNSTFGGPRDRQQRAFPKHDTDSASVFALFAVAVAVAD